MPTPNVQKIIPEILNVPENRLKKWQEIEAEAFLIRMKHLLKERRQKMVEYTKEHPHPTPSEQRHFDRLGKLVIATQGFINVLKTTTKSSSVGEGK